MRKTFAGGGVVLNQKGEVAVVNQNGNSWSLPKGHIDQGESAKQAAEREIKEETGISQLEYVKELGTYERYRIGIDGGEEKNELKTITMFLYKTPEINLAPEDPANPEARWIKPENVVEVLTHPKDKEFFQQILPSLKEFVA